MGNGVLIDSFDNDFAFLSNFYLHEIQEDGLAFPSNEHYFQAMKTLDRHDRLLIAAAPTPGQAKRFGRRVALRPDWENVKYDVMLQALRLKFADPGLKQKLLDTGDAELVEGNYWHDNVWGRCNCPECGGQGKNHLGRLLMQVRSELRAK